MPNLLQNVDMITKAVIAEMKNQSVLLNHVDRRHEDEFGEIGKKLRIRRPNKYKAVDGPDVTGSLQELKEAYVDLTINKHKSVPFKMTSEEMTLNITDSRLRQQHIMPMATELVQTIESEIAGMYKSIYNFGGTPGTTPGASGDGPKDVGLVGNLLKYNSVPLDSNRNGFYDVDASLNLASSVVKNLDVSAISRTALEEARVNRLSQINLFESNSIANHTSGLVATTGAVNGAAQDVTYDVSKDAWTQTLITDGWATSVAGLFKAGDVITMAGVNRVQAKTYEDLGVLHQSVVMADADSDGSGNATLTISPPLITSGAYQNVSAAPADNAVITVVSGTAGAVNPQNLIFHRDAIALVTIKPEAPDVTIKSTQVMDGIALTFISDGDGLTYANVKRLDILFGVTLQIPEWAARHVG